MLCESCKKEVSDNAAFCPFCGAALKQTLSGAQVDPGTPTSQPEMAASTTAAPQAADSSKPSSNKILIGIVIALALTAGIGSGAWWKITSESQTPQESTADTGVHKVMITTQAPNWTSDSTRIPVAVTGTTAAGATVDQVQFMDGTGNGVQLAQGTYTLSFPASPLLASGSLYDDNATTVAITLGSDLADGQDFAPADISLTFSVADPLNISDEQIARAAEYAQKDTEAGATDKAASLQSVVSSARDKARSDQLAAEQAEKDATPQFSGGIYSNQYFTFDVTQRDQHVVSVTEKTDAHGNPVYMISVTMNKLKPDGTPYDGAGAGFEYTVDLAGSVQPSSNDYTLPQPATNPNMGPIVTVKVNHAVFLTNAAG